MHINIGTTGVSSFPLPASNYAIFVPAVATQGYYQGIIGIGEAADKVTAGIVSFDSGNNGKQDLILSSGDYVSGASERVRIRYDGNVGVGTTSPNEKLEVAGRIRANTGFNVNGTNGWSGTYTVKVGGVDKTCTVVGGIITNVA